METEFFPGFDSLTMEGDGADIHVRKGGDGPPVLLLHGYPQTHVMWHEVAPALAERFTVVVADLRGYGDSSCPDPDVEHYAYSKRAMGRDMVTVMAGLGHERFAVVGHDRGGRVAYRLALDVPKAVSRIAVLDIVPTHEMWAGISRGLALRIYHWSFLAQPHPLPEMLIEPAADAYLDHTIASWSAARDLSAFNPAALEAYRASFARPENIRAACEDYRAGATYDYQADLADHGAGRRIAAPLLAVWGDAGIPDETATPPLDVWRSWADDVRGEPIAAGHFLPEENPAALLDLLKPFLAGD
jgi:haloacetate dehalogenase